MINLVRTISNIPCLGRGPVGINGWASNQPDYAHILAASASEIKLIELTNHKSPYVRLISFQALHKKGYGGLQEIFWNHLSDTETIKHVGGCLGIVEPINASFYKTIRSSLSQSRSDSVRIILKKQGDYTLCENFTLDF